ncbi:MAG: hypothetical protein ACYTXI_41400 [Nostoc sp.]
MGYLDSTNLGGKFFFGNHLSTFTGYQGAIAMDFKQAGLSLLGGWIIGVVFMATKLPAPVPPLMGLMEQPFLFGLPQWSDIKVFSSRYGILTYASTVYSPLVVVKLS